MPLSENSPSDLPNNVCNRFRKIFRRTIKSRCNFCIHGPAGTGKSELLRRIHQAMIEKEKLNVVRFTPQTAEQFRNTDTNAQIIHTFSSNENEIINANVIIIDDFSVICEKLFASIDSICKVIRKNHRPFGGIQLIIAGDPYLLGPIDGRCCFESQLWQKCNFKYYKLTQPLRYVDKKWFDMLKRFRRGIGTLKDFQKLIYQPLYYTSNRINGSVLSYQNHEIPKMPKCLFSKISSVKNYHQYKLDQISFPLIYLKSTDYCSTQFCPVDFIHNQLAFEIDSTILIKQTAPVIVTRNIGNISAGTIGNFISVTDNHLLIETKNKNGIDTIKLPQYLFKVNFMWNDKITEAIRYQFPIQLAYATTIHKSLGTEYDQAIICNDDLWAPGHFYTALSRVKYPNQCFIGTNEIPLDFKKINNYSKQGDNFYTMILNSKSNFFYISDH